MAWADETVPLVRALLFDFSDTPTYSDDRLKTFLAVAAWQVQSELVFTQQFAVSISGQTISPDPTVDPTRDDNFVNLMTLKCAANVGQGVAIVSAARGIVVKDGNSAIDLSKVSASQAALLDKGYPAVYERAKFEYQAGRVSGGIGAAVLTPFRLFAFGGYSSPHPTWERHLHREFRI